LGGIGTRKPQVRNPWLQRTLKVLNNHRRNIGQAVVEEVDEILRMIYGQLMRTLLIADIPLQDLFPVNFKEELYAGFPVSTEDGFGWGGSFQKYVDRLYDKDLIGPLRYVNLIHLCHDILIEN
jgi:hypothetical protein